MATPDDDLRAILFRLELTVNTLASTVEALKASVDKSVSVDRFLSVEQRVNSLETWKDWVIKIVLVLVITAVVSLVVTQNGVGTP